MNTYEYFPLLEKEGAKEKRDCDLQSAIAVFGLWLVFFFLVINTIKYPQVFLLDCNSADQFAACILHLRGSQAVGCSPRRGGK